MRFCVLLCQEFDELTAEDQQLMSKKPSKNSKEEAHFLRLEFFIQLEPDP